MVKRKGFFFRFVCCSFCVFVLLFMILTFGVLFVFADDIDGVLNFVDQKIKVKGLGDIGDIGDVDNNNLNYSDSNTVVSSGGGGSGGGNFGNDNVEKNCVYFQQVQYSLGDFIDDVECLTYGVGGCEKVKVTCSSELRNLDYEIGGVFVVEYSVVFDNEVLDVFVVEKNVEARQRSVFRTDVEMNGEFDVSGLGCVVDMLELPSRCLGWE